MSEKEKTKSAAASGGGASSAPPAPVADDDEDEGGGGGAPGWMATFADLVTLLMCFFVLLFAMSSTQQESFKELVQSLKSALGVQQVPEAGTREGLMMPMPEAPGDDTQEEKKPEAVDEAGAMVQKEVDEIVSNVRELIMFNQLGGMVKVEGDELGATITISDVILFPPGEATMNRDGLKIMGKIAAVLAQFNYHIKIAGHTDNTPIHTEKYPSNWELSANRACEIVRYLAKTGINPAQMSAEGYAEYRPIAQNTSVKSRAQNRRVEIVYERRQIADTLSDE